MNMRYTYSSLDGDVCTCKVDIHTSDKATLGSTDAALTSSLLLSMGFKFPVDDDDDDDDDDDPSTDGCVMDDASL